MAAASAGSHSRTEHGLLAARNALADSDARERNDALPSFWSDQYDVRLHAIGWPGLGENTRLLAGSLTDRSFVMGYVAAGRLVGAVAVDARHHLSRWREVVRARRPYVDTLASTMPT